MRKLILLLVVTSMILLVGGVEVFGAEVVTTANIEAYMINSAGSDYVEYTSIKDGFSLDGSPNSNVWAVVISDVNGVFILNGYGYTAAGGTRFRFRVYGTSANPLVPAYKIIFIINDANPELFWVEGSFLLFGSAIGGSDVILGQEYVSINDKDFGDISDIVYDTAGPYTLESVELVTPLVVLISPENIDPSGWIETDDVDPNTSLVWDGQNVGNLGVTYEVHLWDDQSNPEMVFQDVDVESLDVNGYLDWDTIYSWRVDEVTSSVITYSSATWSFHTADYVCQSVLVGDLSGDCKVDFVDFAMMADNWLVEVPKVAAP